MVSSKWRHSSSWLREVILCMIFSIIGWHNVGKDRIHFSTSRNSDTTYMQCVCFLTKSVWLTITLIFCIQHYTPYLTQNLHKKETPKGLYVYYRIIKSLGYPPLGMGITSPGKNGISGILEQGRFLVQRFLGGETHPGWPPGDPHTLPFASPEVLIVDTATEANSSETNSLVILFTCRGHSYPTQGWVGISSTII